MNQLCHYLVMVLVVIGTFSCKKKEAASPEITHSPAPQKTVKHSTEYESLSKAIDKIKAMPKDEQKRQFQSDNLFTRFRLLSADELSGLLEGYDLGKEPNDLIATELLKSLAFKDPARYLLNASKLGEPTPAITNPVFLQAAIAADRNAVFKWLHKGEMGNKSSYLLARGLLNELSGKVPSAEIEILLDRVGDRQRLLEHSYMQWSRDNPETAFKHASSNLSGEEFQRTAKAILFSTSRKDAGEAYRLALSADPKQIGDSYNIIFSNWTKQDIGSAVDALKSMPTDRIQMVLNEPDQAEAVSAHNPDAAVEMMSNIVLTESTKGLFERVAVGISKKDPAQAEEWVGGFPESPTKQDLLTKIRSSKGNN